MIGLNGAAPKKALARRRTFCAWILLAAIFGAAAAAAPPLVPSCSAPEYRQFQFWVGDWVVKSRGGATTLGVSHVESILDGCALREQWHGSSGVRGESFNWYDHDDGRWHQSWVEQGGESLRLEGGLSGEAMALKGEQHKADGVQLERITWTPLPDGRVHQLWETSTDAGTTWMRSFDAYYERRSAKRW